MNGLRDFGVIKMYFVPISYRSGADPFFVDPRVVLPADTESAGSAAAPRAETRTDGQLATQRG